MALHRETGHRLGMARALLTLGRTTAATGDGERAAAHWRHALAIVDELGTAEAAAARALLTGSDRECPNSL